MTSPYLTKLEFMIALPSVIIGVSILTLPAALANVTANSDGWVSIIIAGIIAVALALMAVHIAAHFPGESFFDYACTLVTKPVATFITLIYAIALIGLIAYSTRSVAYIAQQYLFDRTPIEVLGLTFLLVVIYAVSGSRIGLFRLNLLFFPIIFIVFLLVGFLNIEWLHSYHYLPQFTTSMKGYLLGTLEALYGFAGFGIGLFYICMIKEPVKMTKSVLIGIVITTCFYMFMFLIAIGVFSNEVTVNLKLPVLELARTVDIPGAVFERMDAFVYTIWMMAIFNTVSITYDIAVLLWMSVFSRLSKPIVVISMAPVIFFIGMLPRSMNVVNTLERNANIFTLILTVTIIFLFYIMIKWKGISRNETS